MSPVRGSSVLSDRTWSPARALRAAGRLVILEPHRRRPPPAVRRGRGPHACGLGSQQRDPGGGPAGNGTRQARPVRGPGPDGAPRHSAHVGPRSGRFGRGGRWPHPRENAATSRDVGRWWDRGSEPTHPSGRSRGRPSGGASARVRPRLGWRGGPYGFQSRRRAHSGGPAAMRAAGSSSASTRT